MQLIVKIIPLMLFAAKLDMAAQPIHVPVGDTVEIIVDKWGVPHIYASHEDDLFFGQGFNAARDRLFQLEIWRRQATGTVAEILGKR
ncbi:MAG: penicillin acylase family protein, partial [Saprospiraceae bacterium]|nr:penicillin acylase family protein [Saprospiraceae bacterium]